MKSKETGKVLVVEGGGRGSALVHAYSRSSYVKRILAVPGNDLMQSVSEKPVKTFPNLETTSINEILDICEKENVDLVDVAQDNAVKAGLVDVLREKGIPVVGPPRDAGKIEWSKAFARNLGKKIGLPQPKYGIFTTIAEGVDYILKQPEDKGWFVKADGLAEGKAVLPIEKRSQAKSKIRELRGRFKDAARTYLIEDWIGKDQEPFEEGEEFSYFVITDGKVFKKLGAAQDQKRLYNGDKGPNTGGMGSSSPPLLINEEIDNVTTRKIIEPFLNHLRELGLDYRGVVYLGAMHLQKRGEVYVVEWNARWRDPEAEVILPGLKTDIFDLGQAVANQNLEDIDIQIDNNYRIAVAGVAKGYPYDHQRIKGKEIFGIEDVLKMEGVILYGAGVKKEGNRYYVNGGRLFYIVGVGKNPIDTRKKVYSAIERLSVEDDNLHYRTDTGLKDAKRFTK